QQRVHMAIVVDEYGAVAGLVTIEDLVEEIIGDIQDEYDKEEQLFEKLSDNEYIVDAKISVDDFNELLDTKLTGEGYETLGGFVYAQLDKVPTVGDTVRFEDLTITVLATKGRRVTKVKVVRRLESDGEDEGAGSEHTMLPPPSNPPLALPAPAADEQFYSDGLSASPDEPRASQPDERAESDNHARALRSRSSLTRRHAHGSGQSRRH
ncbi:MAG: transporter associated domain-containing protein, partial [Ktedonobacterales bacterium]